MKNPNQINLKILAVLASLLASAGTLSAQAASLAFDADNFIVGENDGSATVTVRLTIPNQEVIVVLTAVDGQLDVGDSVTLTAEVSTSDGTATAGQDYTSGTEMVSFTKTITQQDILNQSFGVDETADVSIPILSDDEIEGDETVNLTLNNVTVTANGRPLQQGEVAQLFQNIPDSATLTITDQTPTGGDGGMNGGDSGDGGGDQVSPIAGLLTGLPGLTPPASSVAGVIEIVCPQGLANNTPELQRDCNGVVGNAFIDPNEASNAIRQLTADQAGTPVDASQSSVNAQVGNVGRRITALRVGGAGVFTGLTFNVDGQAISAERLASLYDALRDQTGGAAGADSQGITFGRLGVFVNGTIDFGDRDDTDNEEGFDFDTLGVTAGLDYRFSDDFFLGLAFGYANTDIDLDNNGGGLDTDGYSVTLYGSYYRNDSFYVDGSLTYGHNDHDQDRRIQYALTDTDPGTPDMQSVTVDQTLFADYDSDQLAVALGTGYQWNQRGFTFGPTGRLQYVNAEVDGYRERAANSDPGSGWTVSLDDQNFESLTLSLGGQASYAWSQTWGVLVPQINVDWVHEFKDDTRFITGRFTGDSSGEPFRLPTDPLDSDYFNVGVGASAQFAQGRSAFVYYEKVLGFDDLDFNTINLGIRLEF